MRKIFLVWLWFFIGFLKNFNSLRLFLELKISEYSLEGILCKRIIRKLWKGKPKEMNVDCDTCSLFVFELSFELIFMTAFTKKRKRLLKVIGYHIISAFTLSCKPSNSLQNFVIRPEKLVLVIMQVCVDIWLACVYWMFTFLFSFTNLFPMTSRLACDSSHH